MKTKFFEILFLLFLPFLSCNQENMRQVSCIQGEYYEYLERHNPGNICTDELCVFYQKIWKELFMEKNNLTENYFDSHIELCSSGIGEWMDGISFGICYKIIVDWAIAYQCDQFIIKIEKNNTLYPSVNLPRDIYLSKEDIFTAVNNKVFASDITKLSNQEHLKFNTLGEALNYLISKAQVNTLCSNWMYIDSSTGNFTLEAWAQFENEENSCIQGKINLITGETFVNETVCYFD